MRVADARIACRPWHLREWCGVPSQRGLCVCGGGVGMSMALYTSNTPVSLPCKWLGVCCVHVRVRVMLAACLVPCDMPSPSPSATLGRQGRPPRLRLKPGSTPSCCTTSRTLGRADNSKGNEKAVDMLPFVHPAVRKQCGMGVFEVQGGIAQVQELK